MSYNLFLPELLTEEELALKKKYELLKKKKKELNAHSETVKKIAEPLPESPTKVAPAHAKEHAKKLVLAGKISLSPKSKEEKTTFKRPERKISSATLAPSPKKDDDNSAADVRHTGFGSFTSKYGEDEGSFHSAELSLSSIMKSFDFDEPTSSARVSRRGPSIYVYANGASLTEETLRSIFGRYGRIAKIKITLPSVAFVTFATDNSAELAITETHGAIYNGVEYTVKLAWRQPPPFMRSSHQLTSSATCYPYSSKSGPGESTNWDFKRRPIVYEDDDDDILLTQN